MKATMANVELVSSFIPVIFRVPESIQIMAIPKIMMLSDAPISMSVFFAVDIGGALAYCFLGKMKEGVRLCLLPRCHQRVR